MPSRFALALSCLLLFSTPSPPLFADDIHWVGYQFGPPGGLASPPWTAFEEGSFFHGDNWLNYLFPQGGDRAIFDEDFDPQGNWIPRVIHFGDFTVPEVPLYLPNSITIPGGNAVLGHMDFVAGDFTLDLGGHEVALTGSTAVTPEGDRVLPALRMGYTGNAGLDTQSTVTVQGGGVLRANGVRFAPEGLLGVGGRGKLVVRGSDTTFEISRLLVMYDDPTSNTGGEIVVTDGATVNVLDDDSQIFGALNSVSAVGAGSVYNSGYLDLRDGATISAQNGGRLNFDSAFHIATGSRVEANEGSIVSSGGISQLDSSKLILKNNSWMTAHELLIYGNSIVEVGGASSLDANQSITVGYAGFFGGAGAGESTLNIIEGSRVSASQLDVASFDGSTGSVSVRGRNSILSVSGTIDVGKLSGDGSLEVAGGAKLHNPGVASQSSSIGIFGKGRAVVSGEGSEWNLANASGTSGRNLVVGGALSFGTPRPSYGSLHVLDKGKVLLRESLIIGEGASFNGETTASKGSVNVDSGGILIAKNVIVGRWGQGALKVELQGQVTVDEFLYAGDAPDSRGEITVDNLGEVTVGAFRVGAAGEGVLSIQHGGKVSTPPSGDTRSLVGEKGKLLVSRGGELVFSGEIEIEGEAEVSHGGKLRSESDTPLLYYYGLLDVTGGKLLLADSETLVDVRAIKLDGGGQAILDRGVAVSVASIVDSFDGSTLEIKGHSTLVSDGLRLYDRSQAVIDNSTVLLTEYSVTVDGSYPANSTAYSTLTLLNHSSVIGHSQADFRTAHVVIQGGSRLITGIGTPGGITYSPTRTAGIVGRFEEDVATVRIEGTDSLWDNIDGYLTVGFYGQGELEIFDTGTAKSIGGQIARETTASGLATISGLGSTWQVAEDLFVGGSDVASGGDGRLVLQDQGAAVVERELRIWENGAVDVSQDGYVAVGDVRWLSPGSELTIPELLEVPGVFVGPGGTLSGAGKIIGDVNVLNGTIAPGASPGKLTIDGDLSSLGVLKLELAGTTPGLFDQLAITGDLSLFGTIEVSLLNGFRPQVGDTFKFFDVGGSTNYFNVSFALPAGLQFENAGAGEFRVVGVPEPSSVALCVLSALALSLHGDYRRASR